MADHSHMEVTHLVHVRVPYHLMMEELQIESSSAGKTFSEFVHEVDELSLKEDELKRVIISAALLLNTGRNMFVGEALDTALVWERG